MFLFHCYSAPLFISLYSSILPYNWKRSFWLSLALCSGEKKNNEYIVNKNAAGYLKAITHHTYKVYWKNIFTFISVLGTFVLKVFSYKHSINISCVSSSNIENSHQATIYKLNTNSKQINHSIWRKNANDNSVWICAGRSIYILFALWVQHADFHFSFRNSYFKFKNNFFNALPIRFSFIFGWKYVLLRNYDEQSGIKLPFPLPAISYFVETGCKNPSQKWNIHMNALLHKCVFTSNKCENTVVYLIWTLSCE